jgi:hypothetical protein
MPTSAETPGPFATHFCIVSGQPIPNLAAALDSRPRPKQAVLLATAEMTLRAERLSKVLERCGVRPVVRPLTDRLNLACVGEDVERVLAELGGEGAVLNATGDQKPMSIAAYEVFRSRGLPAFYVETDNTLTWLHPQERPGFELESRLGIRDYLDAYGYEEVSRDAGQGDGDEGLTAMLVNFAAAGDRALRTLNRAAHEAKDNLLESRLKAGDLGSPQVLGFFRLLARHGVLELDPGSGRVRFVDEGRRAFANGGWLEQHVAAIVAAHRREWGVSELALNLQVRSATGVPNELDVAFLASNHLHIIECKTRAVREADDDADELTQMIYKLDSVRQVGGLVARAMLVSWFVVRPRHRSRADISDITLVSGSGLRKLPQHLAAWISERPVAR